MILNWLTTKFKNIVQQQYGAIRAYSGVSSALYDKFTDDFIQAATANFRCPKAMVEITWASSLVDENVTIAPNDINRIDRTGQLFNGETNSGQKWAYIHAGLVADGSFHPMPALDSDPQMGWYGSDNVSDASGNFLVYPYLEVSHDARAYTRIVVAGDNGYNEYPVDFSITYTHVGGPTIQVVTGNTQHLYTNTFTAIKNVTSIRVTVAKWSTSGAVVKIAQISGDFIETYKADDIVELNVLEETNSDTGVVPIGNVSSNEIDLALLNTDRRFSYGNTDSQYVASLRSGRKIRVWLGFVLPVGSADITGDAPDYIVETVSGEKIGYMPYGVYWSKDWISSYDSQVTNTTAYDITNALSQIDFIRSKNYTGTVKSVVDEILTEALAEVPDLEWEVSANIAPLLWSGVTFDPKNFLEVLKDISEATLSYSYVNRNGVLVVGSRLNALIPVETWQQVDLSVYYNYESQPKIDELINSIRVGITEYTTGTPDQIIYKSDDALTIPVTGVLALTVSWDNPPVVASTVVAELTDKSGVSSIFSLVAGEYSGDIVIAGGVGATFKLEIKGTTLRASIYSSDDIFTIPASGLLEVYLPWSNGPVANDTATVTLTDAVGAPQITSLESYAYGGDVSVQGTAGDTFKISATGVPVALESSNFATTEDDNSIGIYGKREFSLTGNILITTADQAQELADELLTLYGNLRHDGAINWPASTLVSVGDTLEVTEFKSDTVETKGLFSIKRQNIKYNGALQGQTELRRG